MPQTGSVSAGPEAGREIKLGYVAPITGPLAIFGVADQYCFDRAKEAFADGVVAGDGKKHPVSLILQDGQSDSNRAAQVSTRAAIHGGAENAGSRARRADDGGGDARAERAEQGGQPVRGATPRAEGVRAAAGTTRSS